MSKRLPARSPTDGVAIQPPVERPGASKVATACTFRAEGARVAVRAMTRVRTVLLMALVVTVTSACPRKASWIANEKGGYTLFANVQSVDQAVVRFHRSAQDLCGASSLYTLTQPTVVAQNVQGTGWGPPTTILDVRSELTCNR